jgi:hypothetical protein
VCSDAVGEGAFITAVALRDARPQHIILRGSKILSENAWFKTVHKPLIHTGAELDHYLNSVPVDSVVVDQSKTLWEQDRTVLLSALAGSEWRLVSQTNEGPNERRVVLYRRINADVGRPADRNVRVRMRLILGRDLKLDQ